YYEEMGLISSVRSEDYAYRIYDETAVKRLEQILILRKLNISIKDIQRIFNTSGSEVVLEVLSKKVDDIDGEVALLYELKDIVLEFIQQIEKADFSKDSDVKLLYEKAKEIEKQLVNVDYNGNPSNINRLIEVTEKLEEDKLPGIRIVRLPKCKVATSGEPDAAAHEVWNFPKWFKGYDNKRSSAHYIPMDFFFAENCGVVWWKIVDEDATSEDCGGYEIIDFEGGLYAVHTAVDGDRRLANKKIVKWLENTRFERDDKYDNINRSNMWHIIHDNEIKEGLGNDQFETFVPVRLLKPGESRKHDLPLKDENIMDEYTHEDDIKRLKRKIEVLDNAIPRGKSVDVDILTMEKVGKTDIRYIGKKLLMNIGAGQEAGMLTPQNFTAPLRISCRAMTDSVELLLLFGKGKIFLNWANDLDMLSIIDPVDGQLYKYENRGRIPVEEFVDIEWTLGREVMTLKINGELRHAGDQYEYIKVLRENTGKELSYPIRKSPQFGSTVTVERLTVTELE
ncbi:MAG: transcriptional regulator, MerR family, partial [Clostridia bacterium]|nr:transcriptional regulator, MerR family [Clostridia bacterium]